ncbi:MAG: hypothetical protein FJ255_10380 [Phycisphaerae bacterium]|nr:hypothetical protein [Phycisphaerae bacterium]
MTRCWTTGCAAACVVLAVGLAAPAVAQGTAAGAPAMRSTGVPERDTLLRMMRLMTIEFKDARLEDVVRYLGEQTGAELEPMWIDDQNATGLDKEQTISLKVNNVSALTVLEKILARAQTDAFAEENTNTWQMSDLGTLQFGPKARLNKFKRLEIYDINDLLLVIPEFAEAPQFNLDSVLQNTGGGRGGGGGGQSPFQNTQRQQQGAFGGDERRPREERADDIKRIITELVEPNQWIDNAGDGGSIRYYQGTFIVNAADYMHRQLNGYTWWPSGVTAQRTRAGGRYVTLNPEATSSQLNEIQNFPVRIPPP